MVFECTLCQKKFEHKTNLTRHLRKHEGKVFTCEICLKQFNDHSNLKKHIKCVHIRLAEHQCEVCNHVFTQKTHLQSHMRVHTDRKTFQCTICPDSFNQQASLDLHMEKHTGTPRFPCGHCGRNFYNRTHFERHMSSHLREEPLSCTICLQGFLDKGTLDMHMQMFHPQNQTNVASSSLSDMPINFSNPQNMPTIYRCDKCEEQFVQKESLEMHVQEAHALHYEKLICKYCKNIFANEHCLEVHIQSDHPDGASKPAENGPDETANQTLSVKPKLPFSCPICNKPFLYRSNLSRHIHKHEGKIYTCEVCQKEFNDHSNLKKHIKGVHIKLAEYKCHLCGAEFKQKTHLQTHLRTHNDDKKYECTVCPQVFIHKISLELHMEMHLGKSSFTCEYCCCKFDHKEDFEKHMKIHTDEKRYICGLCSNGFITKELLDKHVLKYHPVTLNEDGSVSLQTLPRNNGGKSSAQESIMFPCDICGAQFFGKIHLSRHVQEMHGEAAQPEQFVCMHCGNEYLTQHFLDLHVKTDHAEAAKMYQNWLQADAMQTDSALNPGDSSGKDATKLPDQWQKFVDVAMQMYKDLTPIFSKNSSDQDKTKLSDERPDTEPMETDANPDLAVSEEGSDKNQSQQSEELPEVKTEQTDADPDADVMVKTEILHEEGAAMQTESWDNTGARQSPTRSVSEEAAAANPEKLYQTDAAGKSHNWPEVVRVKTETLDEEDVSSLDENFQNKTNAETDNEKSSVEEDGMFPCAECDAQFIGKMFLHRHVQEFHGKSVSENLPEVVQVKTETLDEEEISSIDENVQSKTNAEADNEMFLGEEVGMFPCEECDAQFIGKKFLNRHVQEFHGELVSENLPEVVQVKTETLDEEDISSLDENLKSKRNAEADSEMHSAEEALMFPCEECGAQFIGKQFLSRHVQDFHGKSVSENLPEVVRVKTETLDEEDISVLDENLQSKTNSKADNEMFPEEEAGMFPCGDCDAQFIGKQFLNRHVQEFHGKSVSENLPEVVQVKTETLDEEDISSLDENLQSKTNAETYIEKSSAEEAIMFPCDECGAQFIGKKFLSRHIQEFHGESVSGNWPDTVRVKTEPLDEEDVSTSLDDNLQCKTNAETDNEQSVAEEAGMFPCEECGAQFLGKTFLSRHVEEFHRELVQAEEFICKHCGNEYLNQHFLDRHVKTDHAEAANLNQNLLQADTMQAASVEKHNQSETNTAGQSKHRREAVRVKTKKKDKVNVSKPNKKLQKFETKQAVVESIESRTLNEENEDVSRCNENRQQLETQQPESVRVKAKTLDEYDESKHGENLQQFGTRQADTNIGSAETDIAENVQKASEKPEENVNWKDASGKPGENVHWKDVSGQPENLSEVARSNTENKQEDISKQAVNWHQFTFTHSDTNPNSAGTNLSENFYQQGDGGKPQAWQTFGQEQMYRNFYPQVSSESYQQGVSYQAESWQQDRSRHNDASGQSQTYQFYQEGAMGRPGYMHHMGDTQMYRNFDSMGTAVNEKFQQEHVSRQYQGWHQMGSGQTYTDLHSQNYYQGGAVGKPGDYQNVGGAQNYMYRNFDPVQTVRTDTFNHVDASKQLQSWPHNGSKHSDSYPVPTGTIHSETINKPEATSTPDKWATDQTMHQQSS